jgi:enoyl-CoA hydratase/carnithine racemase
MSVVMKYTVIELQTNGIGLIKINRPDVMNALKRDVIAELYRAIDIVSVDDSIKVVIITGSGERSFLCGCRYQIRSKY